MRNRIKTAVLALGLMLLPVSLTACPHHGRAVWTERVTVTPARSVPHPPRHHIRPLRCRK